VVTNKKEYPMNNFNYTIETKTIGEFFLMGSEINMNPVGQRPPISEDGSEILKKNQGIIDSILSSINIGQITINKFGNNTPLENRYGFKCESVDGGHRKRAIISFMQGNFKSAAYDCKFSELPDDIKEKFLAYRLNFVVYENLTNYQVGVIFRTLNNTTPVNFMEHLNSYGDWPVANVVRETVRFIENFNTEIHPIFYSSKSNKNSKSEYAELAMSNNRLAIEEIVAKYLYMIWKGKMVAVDKAELEEMYRSDELNSNQKELLKAKTRLWDILTIVQNMGIAYKSAIGRYNGMAKKRFNLYFRVAMFLYSKGDFKFKSDNHLKSLVIDLDRYEKSYNVDSRNKPVDHYDPSPLNQQRTILEQFAISLNEFRPTASVNFCITRLAKHDIDLEEYVLRLDPTRVFTLEQKSVRLADQGYICAIDELPLKLEDAAGAHIVAHCNGGQTIMDNLWVVRSKYNKEMGSMDAREYKVIFDMNRKTAM
jgi:hypothetical protein